MTHAKIAFLGAGNIAQAIIGGLVQGGYPAQMIFAADPTAEQLARLPDGVNRCDDNTSAAEAADVVVFSVKPHLVAQVAEGIAGAARGKLIVSVAAGITSALLANKLGSDTAIIRCMPNTPALVGEGMTGLFANINVTDAQRDVGETLLSAVGKVLWFDDEAQLDMVTAVSGSGPAYFFIVMEAMERAAISLGLPPEASRTLVLQTAFGAARMANLSDEPPATLRQNVTSKGGTTEAAINSLLDSGLLAHFNTAIQAACRRSIELAGTDGP